MLEIYFYPSPNCTKVTICLEELGLPYRLVPIDLAAGEQLSAAYLAINPNNKVPALIDREREITLFESGAILVYLAERGGALLGETPAQRYVVLQWLFWQVGGLGPMAGQAHHFRAFATEQVPYGIRRYTDEVNRLYGVMERRLAALPAASRWLAGRYSIADIACWPWIEPHERQGQDLDAFPHLKAWFETMRERPAVQRALAHGKERHVRPEDYGHLYGQTAASVEAARRDSGVAEDGGS